MNTRGATAQAKTQARKAAQDLLQARMRPITKLAELGVEVDTARAEHDAARERWRTKQEAYADGYRAARDAGWSPAELEEIGCGTQPAGAALRVATRRTDHDDTTSSADTGHNEDYGAHDSSGAPAPEPTDLDAAHAQPS
ncbi:hypothetical protein SAMN05216207_104717 [Pseudonocardia ammonioxydans]|uniref:Uncharacterized protein n=1 Tax=Pseudonocardia ammonioxydans TaxID=260086 RepID=A0A1I5GK19_PSUAM|nr:hypothetical protein [Pseudonocardia ammonioxydans]SFO35931.1 hypothetical protein SAMN05216207_104717 [Pseudonocardia ammonioxydans]